jgi:putative heme-binding domain-containing protein
VAVLASGRVVNGLIVEKADRTLTFQTQSERVVVERSEIEELRPTALSLMPDGLLQTLGDDQIRDLVGYLMSTEQVPLPAAAPDAAAAAR